MLFAQIIKYLFIHGFLTILLVWCFDDDNKTILFFIYCLWQIKPVEWFDFFIHLIQTNCLVQFKIWLS